MDCSNNIINVNYCCDITLLCSSLSMCVTLHYCKANCHIRLSHTLWDNYIIQHPLEVCDGDLVWPTLFIINPCEWSSNAWWQPEKVAWDTSCYRTSHGGHSNQCNTLNFKPTWNQMYSVLLIMIVPVEDFVDSFDAWGCFLYSLWCKSTCHDECRWTSIRESFTLRLMQATSQLLSICLSGQAASGTRWWTPASPHRMTSSTKRFPTKKLRWLKARASWILICTPWSTILLLYSNSYMTTHSSAQSAL